MCSRSTDNGSRVQAQTRQTSFWQGMIKGRWVIQQIMCGEGSRRLWTERKDCGGRRMENTVEEGGE